MLYWGGERGGHQWLVDCWLPTVDKDWMFLMLSLFGLLISYGVYVWPHFFGLVVMIGHPAPPQSHLDIEKKRQPRDKVSAGKRQYRYRYRHRWWSLRMCLSLENTRCYFPQLRNSCIISAIYFNSFTCMMTCAIYTLLQTLRSMTPALLATPTGQIAGRSMS